MSTYTKNGLHIPNTTQSLNIEVKELLKGNSILTNKINDISSKIDSGEGTINTNAIISNTIDTHNIITQDISTNNINVSNKLTSNEIDTKHIKAEDITTDAMNIKDGGDYTDIKDYINNAIQSGGVPDQPITNNYGVIIKNNSGDKVVELKNDGSITSKTVNVSEGATISGPTNITGATNINGDTTITNLTVSGNTTLNKGTVSTVEDNDKSIINKEYLVNYVSEHTIDPTQTVKLTGTADSLCTTGNVKIGYTEGAIPDSKILLSSDGTITCKSITTTDPFEPTSITTDLITVKDTTINENGITTNNVSITDGTSTTNITENSITTENINLDKLITIGTAPNAMTIGINDNDKKIIEGVDNISTQNINVNNNCTIDNEGNITTAGNTTIDGTLTVGQNGITIERTNNKNVINNVDELTTENLTSTNLTSTNISVSNVDSTEPNSVVNIDYLNKFIEKTSGNYFAQKILTSETPTGLSDKDLILLYTNNTYTLEQYINNTFETYPVQNGSLCAVKEEHKIFIKFDDNWIELNNSSPTPDTYNYYVKEISSSTTGKTDDYVFVLNNDTYMLYKKEDNSYVSIESTLKLGSLCVVEEDETIFIRYDTPTLWKQLETSQSDNYHYNSDQIYTTLPTTKSSDYIIYQFTQNNQTYYNLYKWTDSSYSLYDETPIGSECIINETKEVFVKYKDISTPSNEQNWIKLETNSSEFPQNNYYVDQIVSQEPQNPQDKQVIFIKINNVLHLKQYDTSSSSFVELTLPKGALCIVKDDQDIYYNTSDNSQNWIIVIEQEQLTKYHYNSDQIYTTLPTTKSSDYIIYRYVQNNQTYINLYKWNETQYELYNDTPIGSECIINDTKEVFVKYKDTTTPSNEQNWELSSPQNNYYVDKIYVSTQPEHPVENQVYFLKITMPSTRLILAQYNSGSYNPINPPKGTLCIVKDDQDIYYNTSDNIANWIIVIEQEQLTKYHYTSDQIYTSDPQTTQEGKYYFVFNDPYYTLKNSSLETVNAPEGSQCSIESDHSVFIKFKDTNNNQNWVNMNNVVEFDKYNYNVYEILTQEPSQDKPEYVLIKTNNNYELRHLDNDTYTPVSPVNVNSTCLIVSTLEVYSLINNTPNQEWEKTNGRMNYLVDEIVDEEPVQDQPEYIFLNDNGTLILKRLDSNNHYQEFDVVKGSLCIVNNVYIYIKEVEWVKAYENELIYIYNYSVKEISEEKPTSDYPEYILLKDNNYLTLEKFDGVDDYIVDNVPISSICIVNDTKQVYVRFEDDDNHQNWILINSYLDRYNYVVNEILTEEPEHSVLNQVIFIEDSTDNNLYLKQYNGTEFEVIDKTGLLCFVINDNEAYIKENIWIKVIENNNSQFYSTPEICKDDTAYLSDYILYTTDDINYVFKKWNVDTYIQDDNVPYGTYIYIENDKEIFVKEKDLEDNLNQQNWIKHENINNLSHLNVYGPLKVSDNSEDYTEKPTENTFKPSFYVKNSKNQVFGIEPNNDQNYKMQYLQVINSEVIKEYIYENSSYVSLSLNPNYVLKDDTIYFFGRDNANNYLIKINVSNVYIENENVQGITMNDVNLNSYIDNNENVISLVNDGDLIYILYYLENSSKYNINMCIYNIQNNEIVGDKITLTENADYYPVYCCMYDKEIYISTPTSNKFYVISYVNNEYQLEIKTLSVSADLSFMKMFVLNDKLYIYEASNEKLYSYDKTTIKPYNLIEDVYDISEDLSVKLIVDDRNNDIYILPIIYEDYNNSPKDVIFKLEYTNNDYELSHIDTPDLIQESVKVGFINGFILNNKLVSLINNYDYEHYEESKEAFGYYRMNDILYVDDNKFNYNGILDINVNDTKINNNLSVKKITINSNEINDIIKTTDTKEPTDKNIYSALKVDELLENFQPLEPYRYNLEDVSTEIPSPITSESPEYILYYNNDTYTFMKLKDDLSTYEIYDEPEFGTECYIENTGNKFVKEKDLENISNEQNWIEHESINNLTHLNVNGPIKVSDNSEDYYEETTENTFKPNFYVKNSKNQIFGIKTENNRNYNLQYLQVNNSEVEKEYIYENSSYTDISLNSNYVLKDDVIYFFGRNNVDNYLIKINVSNVYIENINVQGIIMNNVNLNSYINNNENVISLVNDGDLIYIVSYIFDDVNYTINLNVYNIQTEEIKPIQLENNVITYQPSNCIIYNNKVYLSSINNEENPNYKFYTISYKNNYVFNEITITLDNITNFISEFKTFVINNNLYIYCNLNGQYVYCYNGNNAGSTIKYLIEQSGEQIEYVNEFIINNNDIYIIPILDDEYTGELKNKIVKLEYLNDNYELKYIDATYNSGITKYGFINGFILSNKLILLTNDTEIEETFGYYKTSEPVLIDVNQTNLYNNVIITNDKAIVKSEPINDNDIVNKKYVNKYVKEYIEETPTFTNGFNMPINPDPDDDDY